MKQFIPFASLAGLLALAVTGLIFLDPDRPVDPRDEPGKAGERIATDAELERKRVTTLNHVEARIRVARAVIAGHLTPLQGAEQLRDLHLVNPYFDWEHFRKTNPGATDLERCCQQLQDTIGDELATIQYRGEQLAPLCGGVL
jgi:hypothetical protein